MAILLAILYFFNGCPQTANVGAYRIRPDAPTYPRRKSYYVSVEPRI